MLVISILFSTPTSFKASRIMGCWISSRDRTTSMVEYLRMISVLNGSCKVT